MCLVADDPHTGSWAPDKPVGFEGDMRMVAAAVVVVDVDTTETSVDDRLNV